MPVNASIRSYIDSTLLPSMDDELFTAHFEIVVLEIFRLLPARPEEARHTTAYFCYHLSFLYMRSQNEAVQAGRAQAISRALRCVYNHRTPLETANRTRASDSYPVVILLDPLHQRRVEIGRAHV